MEVLEKTIWCFVEKTSYMHDTSLGNRLHFWAQAFYISYRTNFEYKIVLQKELWPELIFLHLPNTHVYEKEKFFNFENLPEFSEDQIEKIVLEGDIKELETQNHWGLKKWVITCDFHNNILLKDIFKFDPFTKIEFKKREITNFFKEEFKNHIGVHIRRFGGVPVNYNNIQSIPEPERSVYVKDVMKLSPLYSYHNFKSSDDYKSKLNDRYIHPFIPDSYYYMIMDKIISYNSYEKFYLSTDLKPEHYTYYKKKYIRLYDRYSYKKRFYDLLKNHYSSELLDKTINLWLDLFDFFALASSKLILQSHFSSWGRSAKRIFNTQEIVIPVTKGEKDRIQKMLKWMFIVP